MKYFLAKHGVKLLRAYLVPEHPPGHRDHPHHDEDHHHYVIDKVAAIFTATAGDIITATSLELLKVWVKI